MLREGVKRGPRTMPHRKIAMKTITPAEPANCDFAALADQLIQDNWHLPAGGDQSWREQDAFRIFSAHGKSEINDRERPPPAADSEPPDDDESSEYQPGFETPRTLSIFLPLAF